MIPRKGFYLREEEQWFGKASQKAESVSLLSVSPALSHSSDLVPLQLLVPVHSIIKAAEERQYQVWGRDWRETSVQNRAHSQSKIEEIPIRERKE